jgi:hypothetical protein
MVNGVFHGEGIMLWKRLGQAVVASVVLATAVFSSAPAPASAAVGEVYGPYLLVEESSGLCLDNPNSNPNDNVTMTIYNCLGGNNQLWYNNQRSTAPDYWTFNMTSRKCLTVKNAATTDNAPVLQFTCNDGGNERWRYNQVADDDLNYFIRFPGVTYVSDGRVFQIKNLNSDKCLTVKNRGTTNGSPLLQFDCSKPGSNRWKQFRQL